MANELQNKTPADTYKDVLHLGTATGSTPGTGLPATTLQIVYDGAGVPSKLKLSKIAIEADNISINNGTINSLTVPITVAQGGTGGATPAAVKILWAIDKLENIKLTTWDGGTDEAGAAITPVITKLGTIATGVWEGTTIAVNKGGTGVTSLSSLATSMSLNNVENTAVSTWAGTTNITTLGTIATGVWEGTTIAVNKGGTGATDIITARANLGLGSIATQNSTALTATGGTLDGLTINNCTISNPAISILSSISIGDVLISSASLVHSTSGNFLNIPYITNTSTTALNIDVGTIKAVRTLSSTADQPPVSIIQYSTETVDLLRTTNTETVTTSAIGSSGTLRGVQLGSSADYMSFRNASEAVTFGSASQYSVSTGTLNVIESHDSQFTAGNISVGDVVQIRQTTSDPWEIREVLSIESTSSLTLTDTLGSVKTNTIYFERISSAATNKFKLENNGTVNISGGGYNSGHLVLGAWHLWVDATGDLRMNSGAPTTDTDGSVVGSQS
jgi:hypothetical protein